MPPARRGTLARATGTLAALGLAAASLVAAGAPAAAAGADFEIDGNQATDTTLDWETVEGVSVVTDAVGQDEQAADPQTYFGPGDQEGDWPDWSPAGTPPSGKSDVGNVLVASEVDDDFHQWLYLGFDRVAQSGQGTGRYYVELNQADTTGELAPTRTEGDLRIVIADRGNVGLDCQSVDVWDGDSWSPTDCSAFDVAVNDEPVADFYGSPVAEAGMIGENRFVETKIDLTELGVGGTCPAAGFATVHLRSQEGQADGEGKLKDDAEGPIDVPSLCADVTILKANEDGEPLAGAEFTVSPDPATPGDADSSTTVTTGEDGTVTFTELGEDAWGVELTVTETAAPEGYLLPPPGERTRTVTLEPGASETLTFTDPLAWQPLELEVAGEAVATITHEWTVDKAAAEDEVTIPADQESVELSYEIVVTEGAAATTSDRSASVTVTNPNDGAVTGTLDVVMNGEPCTVDGAEDADPGTEGLQVELPAGETSYDVTCDTAELGGTATATVTWDRGTYPETQDDVDDPENAPLGTATAATEIDPTTTHVNGSIEVWDDFVAPDDDPELLGTVDTQGEGTTTSFDVTRTVEVPQGECLDVVNDAYLVADGTELDRDTATVRVCREVPSEPTPTPTPTVPTTEPTPPATPGPTPPTEPTLPRTGANIALGVLGALLLAGAGTALVALRRRIRG